MAQAAAPLQLPRLAAPLAGAAGTAVLALAMFDVFTALWVARFPIRSMRLVDDFGGDQVVGDAHVLTDEQATRRFRKGHRSGQGAASTAGQHPRDEALEVVRLRDRRVDRMVRRLLQLADHAGVDLAEAVENKLVKNAIKHPVPPVGAASVD